MSAEGHYLAYLVRLWTVSRNGDVVWRASAKNAHTGEERAFASVATLCRFLEEASEARPGPGPAAVTADAPARETQ